MFFDVFCHAVSNIGFPIAITAFLLLRMDKTLTALTQAIQDLRTEISSKNATH